MRTGRPKDPDVYEGFNDRHQMDVTYLTASLVMSCRVLGRKVEQMVLREILLCGREAGIDRVRGRYIPTEKNALVRDHYEKLGFAKVSEQDGTTTWEMPVTTEIAEVPMQVTRSRAAALAA